MNRDFKEEVERVIRDCLKSKSGNSQFAVSTKLDENFFRNNCVKFKDVGEVPLPASLDNLRKLTASAKNISTPIADVAPTYEKNGKVWQISGSEAIQEDAESSEFFEERLTKTALLLMGLDPTTVQVDTVLQHLIICETGSIRFPHNPNNGGFIKMILQIPVEGGHEGGRIKVELHDQIRLFNLSEGSERFYHLTAFYSDCEHLLEEVTFGWRLAMVFNLTLKTSESFINIPPKPDLATFLAVNNLEQILAPLNQQDPLDSDPKFLILLLEHRYTSSELNFHQLRGNDRRLVQLLNSIDSIDLNLAILQKHEAGTIQEEDSDYDSGNCDCCLSKGCCCQSSRLDETTIEDILEEDIKILKWIGVDDQTVSCTGLDVNDNSQMITFGRPMFYKPDEMKLDHSVGTTSKGFLSRWYYSAVLLIWPKNKSLEMTLRSNFMTALDHVERNLKTEELCQVITFCDEHPDRVWTSSPDREEKTLRLVELCLKLEAKTEGLKLLESLADEFSVFPEVVRMFVSVENIEYEGIRSKAIAMKIAKLIVFIGWTVCSEVVYRFVTIQRTDEQIENFAHLATALLDLGCIEGGKIIGYRVCSFLFSDVHGLISRSSASAVVACASMILRMQELEGAGPFRIHSFQMLLVGQPLSKFFPVVEGINQICSGSMDSASQRFQRDLHRHLATCQTTEELAVDIMIFFLRLDDAILLKEFTNKVLNEDDGAILQILVSSPDIWNLGLSTMGGRWALRLLVNARIRHLEQIAFPEFTWVQECKTKVDPQVDIFLRSTSFKHTFQFNCHRWAEEWMERNFGTCQQLDNRISVNITIEEQDSKVFCVVTKTKEWYNLQLEAFHQTRLELVALCDRRRRRLGDENSATNLLGIPQIHSPKSSKRARIE